VSVPDLAKSCRNSPQGTVEGRVCDLQGGKFDQSFRLKVEGAAKPHHQRDMKGVSCTTEMKQVEAMHRIDILSLLLIISKTERQRRGRVGIEHRSREQAGRAERLAREVNVEWPSEPQREIGSP
jgi:hypothetical protein